MITENFLRVFKNYKIILIDYWAVLLIGFRELFFRSSKYD